MNDNPAKPPPANLHRQNNMAISILLQKLLHTLEGLSDVQLLSSICRLIIGIVRIISGLNRSIDVIRLAFNCVFGYNRRCWLLLNY
mgnify:CR=1 FL=1